MPVSDEFAKRMNEGRTSDPNAFAYDPVSGARLGGSYSSRDADLKRDIRETIFRDAVQPIAGLTRDFAFAVSVTDSVPHYDQDAYLKEKAKFKNRNESPSLTSQFKLVDPDSIALVDANDLSKPVNFQAAKDKMDAVRQRLTQGLLEAGLNEGDFSILQAVEEGTDGTSRSYRAGNNGFVSMAGQLVLHIGKNPKQPAVEAMAAKIAEGVEGGIGMTRETPETASAPAPA